MWAKAKWIIISIVILIIIGIGVVGINLWKNGFTLLTYTTNNRLEKQLESILEDESNTSYEGKVKNLGFKKIDNEYLGFFAIEQSTVGEVLIVSYEDKGNFGMNQMLNLNRVVKGDNSIVMIDMDNTHEKYIVLVGADKESYAGINILDKNSEKILKEIDFEKDDEKTYISEKLDQKNFIIQYSPENKSEIKLELVKKSGN